MTPAALVLFSVSLLNTKPAPVFADVMLGPHGPYRFLVDTGAETSLLDAKLATALHIAPQFRVEIVTQNSSRVLPAATVRNIRVGERDLHDVELVFEDVTELRRLETAVRGLLGANALGAMNFTLTPGSALMVLGGDRPDGIAVPLRRVGGRFAVDARMGDETLTLILDSGASHVVLFGTPRAMAKTKSLTSTFATMEGARRSVPTTWTADMFFGPLRLPMLPAAIVKRDAAGASGLLPASAFEQIYVDQSRNEIVLVPKRRS